jgi:putative acetyltransferase
MNVQFIIRYETPDDIGAISEVTASAFKTLAISQQTEPYIILTLRAAGALTLSLVAELDGTSDWYGLGPVSVLPEYQGRGIGSALIRKGLAMLRELGAQGCYLVGDPKYYHRFGFRVTPELVLEGVPPEVCQALPLGDRIPTGSVTLHEGFGATADD